MPDLIDNLRGLELDAAVATEVGWTQVGDEWYMPGQTSPISALEGYREQEKAENETKVSA